MTTQETNPRRLGHVPALDGLRGIAVLLVLLRHLPEVAPGLFENQSWLRGILDGGYLGVDVFFVLSGFLITSLLAEAFDNADNGTRVWRNFYGRRALRLLPAMVGLVGVFTVVSVVEGSTLGSLWPSVRSVLLYYNNWHSVWDPEHFTSDLGHLWSLAIEEQFYIVWPVVLAAVMAFSTKLRVRLVLVGLPIVWVAWYRMRVWETGVGWANVFVRTDARVDALLVGCLLALVFRYAQPQRRVVMWMGTLGGLVLLGLVATSSPLDSWMYRGGFSVAAFAAGAVVLALSEGAAPFARVISTRVLRSVGRVSYGLYLWHFPVFRYVGRHTESWSTAPRIAVAVGAAGVLTVASWFAIERIALSRKDKWFGAPSVTGDARQRPTPSVPMQYFWRAVVSVGTGSLVTLAVANVWPRSSVPMTDRMGYALIADFALNRYWQIALLWVLFMPIVAVFVWSLLPRLAVSRAGLASFVGTGALPRVDFDDRVVCEPPHGGMRDTLGRLVLVGATAGLLVASSLQPGVANGWWWLTLCVAAYAGGVCVLARVGSCAGEWQRRVAALNLLFSSSLPVMLWWASRSTYIVRSDNGKRVDYPWIPLVPMAVIAVVLLAVDAVWLHRNGAASVQRRERARLVFFVVPVMLFTWVSNLRPSTGNIDVFHHGESLNGGWLWATGRVPWRDFFFNVGFYPAVLAPRAAFRLFGTSIWGLVAGTYMFLIPILIVSIYLACAALVSRYWVALAATTLFLAFPAQSMGGFLRILNGDPTLFIFRFSFMAPATIALLLFLRKSTWTRGVVFGLCVIVNLIMSSETIVFATAFCAIIFLRDAVAWRRGQRPVAHFAATIRAAVGMVVGIGAGAATLAAIGALGAYIGWWRIFPFRWYIETGIPIGLGMPLDSFRWGSEWVVIFAIPLSVLVGVWFIAWRLRSRRDIRAEDWAALALALGNLLFFQKALNRPDSHVYQSLITAIPLWLYIAVRAITTTADVVKQRSTGHIRRPNAWLAMAAVVALFPFMPVAKVLNERMADAGSRWKVTSGPVSNVDRIGYTDDGAFVQTTISVRDFVNKNLGEDALIFDFANTSGLYNFVLDQRPISRFSYAVQMSTRPAMREVIAAMKARSPDVVVYAWDATIDEWDRIPNSIRHYDLGEYILRNYTPWAVLGEKGYKQTLMLRNDLRPGYLMPADATPPLAGAERNDDLMQLHDCDWGRAASHMSVVPVGGERLKADPVLATVTAFGWARTDSDDPVEISVRVGEREIFRGLTTPNRPDLAERNVDTGKNSGFYFDIPVIEPIESADDVTVARVESDGSFDSLPRVAKQGVNDATGEYDIRLNQGIDGQVPIGGGADRRFVMRIEFPGDRADLSWLTVRSAFGFAETNFLLYDKALDPTRRITFRAAPRTHVAGGLMAACPKWFAWDTNVLYLEYDHAIVGPEVYGYAEVENR